jgi:dipeptidyl aminopeptidase/acylaminoacyl peptidase
MNHASLALPIAALLLATSGPAAAVVRQETVPLERFLQMRSAVSPSPSPDGSEVAFLTNLTGVMQAWRVPAAGGWPSQVSFTSDLVRGVSWSPRGDLIAWFVDRGGAERLQIWVSKPDGSSPRLLSRDADKIYNFGGWSPDGTKIAWTSNERDERYFDLYEVEVATGRARLLHREDAVLRPGQYSPDGRWLAFVKFNTLDDLDLYARELSTGRTVHLNHHDTPEHVADFAWHPDSRSLLVAADRGRDRFRLVRVSLAEPNVFHPVFEPEWGVEAVNAADDTVAVVVNEDGYSRLHLLAADTLRPRLRPRIPDGVAMRPELTRDGRRIFFAFTGPTDNADILAVDAATGAVSRVTKSDTAGIDRSALVHPRLLRIRAHDGLEIPGYLYLPPGKGPHPLVVWVHGGPESQERPRFSAVYQYLLSRGLAIYTPNIRGSTGYGAAYQAADNVERRWDAIRDVRTAAEWLVAHGVAAPGRIAIAGGSYGGYMTVAQLAFHPDTFAAGVDVVGIVNFETFLEETHPFRRPLREAEYGSLEKDRETLRALSPIHRLDAITAPLMVIHGVNDMRVPVNEARQVVRNLEGRGVKVEAIFFPDEGHGLAKLPNRIHGYTRMADFLLEQLAGRGRRKPTEGA